MAELPLDQGIPRFKSNEERLNVFINGSNTASMTTDLGASIPSVAKLAKTVTDNAAALIAAKDAEINAAADSILSGSESARDAAVAAKDTTLTARDATIGYRDAALTARAGSETARDQAVDAAAEVAAGFAGAVHEATDITSPDLLSEIGFWNNLSGVLGKITFGNLISWVRQSLIDITTPTGAFQYFDRSTAPTGWLKANGITIGSPSSGAGFADNTAKAYFLQIWNNFSNTVRPILNSNGTVGTRGVDALTDWNANKRLPIADRRGVVQRGWDDGRGIDTGRALGSYQEQDNMSHGHGAAFNGNYLPDHAHNTTIQYMGGFDGPSHPTWGNGDFANGFETVWTSGANIGLLPTGSVSIQAQGSETRMRNYADLCCVKL